MCKQQNVRKLTILRFGNVLEISLNYSVQSIHFQLNDENMIVGVV